MTLQHIDINYCQLDLESKEFKHSSCSNIKNVEGVLNFVVDLLYHVSTKIEKIEKLLETFIEIERLDLNE